MNIILPILYLLILVFHVIMLIACIKRPTAKKWLINMISEAISALCALGLCTYYDNLTGVGMMPGLTYFAHAFYSLVAFFVFVAALIVSVAAFLIKKNMP